MHQKVNAAAKGPKAWYAKIGSKLWGFCNSLKLTLTVLITLAVVSVIGTVVEQNKALEYYITTYGVKWTKVILYFGVYDMYHTLWFQALLALLVVNIIVCTMERFPPKWKSLLRHKPNSFGPKLIEKFSNNMSFRTDKGAGEVRDTLLAVLKKKKYKVHTLDTTGGGNSSFYAWRGVIGRFGSDMTHISLLLILLGAIIGSAYGYKDFKAIYVGGEIQIPQADFKLKLDKFWIEYYDTGQIRQYNSLLTVIEDGKEVLTKQIWVNEPLYYKGIRFYQSSFGTAWDKIEKAKVAMVDKAGENKIGSDVIIKWEELTGVPNSPYSVKLIGYSADFAYDDQTNEVFSKSGEANNPAINIEVYRGEELISTPWIFMNYPGLFPALSDSDDDMIFTGLSEVMYSGLSINKDPGTNIVWLGTAVMGIGFFLAFFVFHRRLWICVRESDNSVEVMIGGMINKNNYVLEKDIKEIAEGIEGGKKV
jgi:cytochrome c biogenesis protein